MKRMLLKGLLIHLPYIIAAVVIFGWVFVSPAVKLIEVMNRNQATFYPLKFVGDWIWLVVLSAEVDPNPLVLVVLLMTPFILVGALRGLFALLKFLFGK